MRYVLYIIIALGLGYLVMSGLGLTHAKKHTEKKAEVLDDFEDADHDLDWSTEGYAKLESAKENQTHGKRSAKITFLIPAQFRVMPTATPVAAPAAAGTTLAAGTTNPPSVTTPVTTPTWQPKITLDTRSVTQLKVFDWQEYKSLKLDVFNPQDRPLTYHVQITDSKTYRYDTNGPMIAKKVTNIAIPIDDLAAARMDLSNIASIHFWVEPVGAAQPVSVYLDYLRLEAGLAEVKKK